VSEADYFHDLSSGEPDSPVAESGEEYNGVSRLIDMVEFSDPQNLAGNQRVCACSFGLTPRTEIFRCRFATKKDAT